jgi:uncharacterized protein (TIGR00297 family)
VKNRVRRDLLRQSVHIAAGFPAILLRWVSPLWLALLAAIAVLFNSLVLPRWAGLGLWRAAELRAARAPGVVIYPVTVLLLLGIFGRKTEVAAAGWGLLAFGDGAASVVGMVWGRRRLPWNPGKSWAGLLAYWWVGTVATVLLILWTAPGRYETTFVCVVGLCAALTAALLESLPLGLDDNLTAPLAGSLMLLCLLLTEGGWVGSLATGELQNWSVALGVNLLLAAGGYCARSLTLSGAVAACSIGTLVLGSVGWSGYGVLLSFFILGSAATHLGYRRKRDKQMAQGHGGRRSARNALANGLVAAACALFAARTAFPGLFTLGFVGALAAAAADTVESEIGQLWGSRTVLITSLQAVPPGTDGGISVAGSGAGLLAAWLVAVVGWTGGMLSASQIPLVALAGFLATLLESIVGATLERRQLLDNEAVNFVNTLAGALLTAGLLA